MPAGRGAGLVRRDDIPHLLDAIAIHADRRVISTTDLVSVTALERRIGLRRASTSAQRTRQRCPALVAGPASAVPRSYRAWSGPMAEGQREDDCAKARLVQ